MDYSGILPKLKSP